MVAVKSTKSLVIQSPKDSAVVEAIVLPLASTNLMGKFPSKNQLPRADPEMDKGEAIF